MPAADLPLYSAPPPGLERHPLFSGQSAILSGDNPRFPSIPGGHEALLAELRARGIRHEPTVGQYGGQQERAVIAYGVNRDQALDLGKRFGQAAVISSNGNDRELVYTNGPRLGTSHPAHGRFGFGPEAPPDDFMSIPGKGYARFYFDSDRLRPPPLPPVQQMPAQAGPQDLGKALPHAPGASFRTPAWPGAYPHHDGHPAHARRSLGPGVLVPGDAPELLSDLSKAEIQQLLKHQQRSPAESGEWAQHSAPYGTNTGAPSSLSHYPLLGKLSAIEALVAHHGFRPYLVGGKYGRPDLTTRNYGTGFLPVWNTDSDAGSAADHDAARAWRLSHELAHALTQPAVNAVHGEGRRTGALGKHRSTREAKRAVTWAAAASDKQRQLLGSIGVRVPDHVFNQEKNTVLADAVHRAVTGRHLDPAAEGFRPHAHAVPLEVAHRQVDEAARKLGLQNDHDLVRKSESMRKTAAAKPIPSRPLSEDLEKSSPQERIRKLIALAGNNPNANEAAAARAMAAKMQAQHPEAAPQPQPTGPGFRGRARPSNPQAGWCTKCTNPHPSSVSHMGATPDYSVPEGYAGPITYGANGRHGGVREPDGRIGHDPNCSWCRAVEDDFRRSEDLRKSPLQTALAHSSDIQHGLSAAWDTAGHMLKPTLHHLAHTVMGLRQRAAARAQSTPQSPGEPNVNEGQ